MADENMSLRIDPESRDLVIDADGNMEQTYGDETTAQGIRLTLQAWKGEFALDPTHGTQYDRILGKKPYELPDDEAEEVIREAIFQEADVSHVDNVAADIGNMAVEMTLEATLYSGQRISMEVKA